ncbi:hypothetical protein [Chroococcidiopsis sp. SAG 2025]|nr:hypothetical protein [Chroococcidiopsis sp. SAG 2025]
MRRTPPPPPASRLPIPDSRNSAIAAGEIYVCVDTGKLTVEIEFLL